MTAEEHGVLSVNVSEEKGTIKLPVGEIVIDETGIVGDAHAGPWHRQVSLLAQESIERFGREESRQFNPGEFAENITTRGLNLDEVAVLDRLACGDVLLEVTQIGKGCHGDNCAIYRQVERCVMPKEGVFTRVVRGGRIKPGAALRHERRPFTCWIITVSDRASRGVYEDRGGPRVRELVEQFMQGKRWHLRIEQAVVPDDPQRIEAELKRAQAAPADLVITTGGTGIGPHDITPEVVVMRCSKLIPGVMEQIRAKTGATNPHALLSRGVAGVMGHGLIYTLPGSVRAVDEYMEEIFKTVEHLVLMLHGIDAHS